MSTIHSTTRSHCGIHRRRFRRDARRGAVALTAIWMMVIFLLIAAWVLNYNFLVLVNRNMQQKCDALVLAGAPALLDEDLLRDYPGPPIPDQTDDFVEASEIADQYRRWNNQGQPRAFDIHADDMTVASGYVADITGGSPYLFDDSIPLDAPVPAHNTLCVRSQRLAEGNHPVRYILDLFNGGTRRAADVRSGGYATLDNLLVGFRPGETAASPVMPLGIDAAAWNSERAAGGDSNTNRIRELVVRLDTPRPDSTDANAALLFFDGAVDVSVLSSQMALGLLADDLPPHGELGPITAALPQSVTAMQRVAPGTYPGLNAQLALMLNDLVSAGVVKRVFPLYDTFDDGNDHNNGDDDHGGGGGDGVGTARLVGFVAARVLFAGVVENRLTVAVEPCFIIHHTAWTVGPGHGSQPRRNPYIHKLRLSH